VRTSLTPGDFIRCCSSRRSRKSCPVVGAISRTSRSCQMAIAFRPRRNASAIGSRYGSQALAVGARDRPSPDAHSSRGGCASASSPGGQAPALVAVRPAPGRCPFRRRATRPSPASTLGRAQLVAGSEVSTNRSWMSTEDRPTESFSDPRPSRTVRTNSTGFLYGLTLQVSQAISRRLVSVIPVIAPTTQSLTKLDTDV